MFGLQIRSNLPLRELNNRAQPNWVFSGGIVLSWNLDRVLGNSKNLKYSLTSVPHYKIRYITGSKWSGRISAGKKEKCSFDAPWLMIFDLSPLCGYQNRIEILLQEKKENWDHHHIRSIIYNYFDNYLGQSISTFLP